MAGHFFGTDVLFEVGLKAKLILGHWVPPALTPGSFFRSWLGQFLAELRSTSSAKSGKSKEVWEAWPSFSEALRRGWPLDPPEDIGKYKDSLEGF